MGVFQGSGFARPAADADPEAVAGPAPEAAPEAHPGPKPRPHPLASALASAFAHAIPMAIASAIPNPLPYPIANALAMAKAAPGIFEFWSKLGTEFPEIAEAIQTTFAALIA